MVWGAVGVFNYKLCHVLDDCQAGKAEHQLHQQLDRTLTNDNGAGYHIVQASAMHGHRGD